MEHSSARPYQLELLDAALEDNTIVLLGTGAGKTFIAVLLIKDLSHMILGSYNDDPSSKRTIFLVNTVPLVTQQASYINAHMALSVGQYVGEMGVDNWGQERWNLELETNHILVMTRQIFLNLLSHGFMNISRVNLLIFDECHHAVKNDAYVQIMRFYNMSSEEERPHILGLSASIISGKCKPEKLSVKLKELEVTLCSRTETAKDLAEVAKYATNPHESIRVYFGLSINSSVFHLKLILDHVLQFTHHSVRPRIRDSVPSKLVTLLEECIYVLENISISSAIEAVVLIRNEINELLDARLEPWDKRLCELTLLKLSEFSYECNISALQGGDDYSPKFSELLKVLVEFDSQMSTVQLSENDTKFCGIIFVEQRSTAVCLSRLLQKLQGSLLHHIKCHFIVGHSMSGGRTLEQSMNVKTQQEVLRKFRSEQLNLLIATSVVEEGLDVPKCNMVIRYDFPKTFQSHVQSKGRARARNSRYLLLVHQEELAEKKRCLDEYIKIEKTLAELCHDREVPNEDEVERRLRYRIPPYRPLGPDGPSISINESLSLLHRYCQKLPTDRYTVLAPEFEVILLPDNHSPSIDGHTYVQLYLATVHLPMSSPVNEATGRPLPRSSLAKKTAALEAIKLLHEAGELDNHLKPITREDEDSDEEDEEKMYAKNTRHAGTHKKITYYKNKVALCLRGVYPVVGDINYLYTFAIHYKESGKYYQLTDDEYCNTLGLLTSKPLPYTKIPPFSLYIGHAEVIVNLIETTHLIQSKTELELYETFHKVLFSDILCIKNLEFSAEISDRSYLVVPVTFAPKASLSFIDIDLLKDLIKFPKADLITPSWPFNWRDKLIIKNYTLETINNKPQLYQVLSFDPQTTPFSEFPDQNAMTYSEYFYNKYGYVFTHYDDPALICHPISSGVNSLRLISTRFKNHPTAPLPKPQSSEIKLFPELCKVWPVCASFWKYSRCVPSIIKRIESLLLVNELSNEISATTQIGLGSNYEYEQKTELRSNKICNTNNTPLQFDESMEATATTNGHTQHYSIHEHNNEDKSIFYRTNGDVIDSETSHQYERQVVIDCVLRRPGNSLLYQSLTPSAANDAFDLERLETLGDSFLKLSTTISLFCSRNKSHEGKLTNSRKNRISNFNLCYLAKKKGLPLRILSQSFDPLSNWTPPSFSLSLQDLPSSDETEDSSLMENRIIIPCLMPDSIDPGTLPDKVQNYYYHKTTDKGIADCIEALIGAYLISGGIESALKLMEWVGIKCPKTSTDEDMISCSSSTRSSRTQSQSSVMSIDCVPLEKLSGINYPILYEKSSDIFGSLYIPPSPLLRDDVQGEDIFKMIAVSIVPGNNRMTLCDRLSWTFSNPALLLEALTHPSYSKNRYTSSYQRLEFLGDAVLDYLVTCCLYSEFPNYTPGQLTEARSVLVNNINFAKIAVKCLQLHTCLLHRAPELFKLITEYVNHVAPHDHIREEEEEEEVMYCQYEKNDSNDLNVVNSPLEEYTNRGGEDDDEVFEILEPPKVLGDVLESVAGALFIDSGMSLEAVWRRFYPFFKPTIDKFKISGPPVHPLQELLRLNQIVEINQDPQPRRSKHRCTITVINKDMQVSCVASTLKAAKIGAAKRILTKLKELD